ncbi:hypothetical protein [Streptomyces sp. NPDC057877]|uniref:hypothetical protein n=1 Tax=Streptomyces sp. NPDC057877 TaxID=3346269 RepID=UPI0036BD0CFA
MTKVFYLYGGWPGHFPYAIADWARSWAPMWALKAVTDHSIDLYLTTENLPDPDNRVRVDGARAIIDSPPPNNTVRTRSWSGGSPRRYARPGTRWS